MAGLGDVFNLLVKISGDGKDFRDDVRQDIATLDELLASLHDTAVSINLDDVDAEAKLEEFKLKLDELRNATERINLDDLVAKEKLDEFKLKLDELRNETVAIDLNDEDAKLKIDDLKLKLDDIRNAHAAIDIDDTDAKLKIDDIAAKLFKLRDDGNIDIRVHDADAMLKLDNLERKLDNIKIKSMNLGGSPSNGAAAGAGGGAGILPWLIGAGVALAPAAGAPTLAGAGGLLSAFLPGLAGSAGLFAVMTSNITEAIKGQQQLQSATQAVAKAEQAVQGAKTYQQWLTATQGLTTAQRALAQEQQTLGSNVMQTISALNQFEAFWKSFTNSLQSPVLAMFRGGLTLLEQLLTDMKPVISASAQAFTQLEAEASKALGSPFWKTFFQWLSGQAKNSIMSFAESTGNLVKGFSALMMAFQPMAQIMEQGLLRITQRFAEWASHLSATEGFKKFLDYARANGPVLMDTLGQIFSLLGKVLVILAPLSGGLLRLVDYVLRLANAILSGNSIVRQFIDYVILAATEIVNVVDWIAKLITGIVQLGWSFKPVNEAWKAMEDVAKNVWNAIKSDTQTAIQGIKDGFQNLVGALTSAWNNIRDAVSKGARNAWNAMTTVFDGLKGYFTNLAQEAVSWGENIVHSIAQGITNAISSVKSAVSNVASSIKSFIGFHSPTEEGPGSEADVWMPNLMNMLVQGIQQGVPRVRAALSQVFVPPGVANMMQSAGQSFASSIASGIAQTVHAPVNININAPVYGIDDLNQAIKQGVQEHALPVLVQQLKPTARAMGVS